MIAHRPGQKGKSVPTANTRQQLFKAGQKMVRQSLISLIAEKAKQKIA
jgi:hypothetical protein